MEDLLSLVLFSASQCRKRRIKSKCPSWRWGAPPARAVKSTVLAFIGAKRRLFYEKRTVQAQGFSRKGKKAGLR